MTMKNVRSETDCRSRRYVMKVLYATDGLPGALAAGNSIISMFRRDALTITAVSVTHSGSLDPGHILLELDPLDGRRDDSLELAQSAAVKLREQGFRAESKVLEGHPGQELLKEATHGNYDLVVVGSGSHTWISNHLLGSVSTLLLHEAPCSVLVTHESLPSDGPSRVLVGVDGSKASDQTVLTLTRVLDPARVKVEVLSVVGVHLPTAMPALVGTPLMTRENIDRMDHESSSMAEGYAERARRTMERAGFQVTARVEYGGATTVLLEEARQTRADLIAVGSRGLGPIRRVLLGSVSDQIARHGTAAFVGRGEIGVS
jgi:nucleotide-binding universal stress UspA family protein